MHQAVFHCCTDPAALRLRAADWLLEGYEDLRADIGFSVLFLLVAAHDRRLQVEQYYPRTCVGACLVTPFISCGKHCPCVPLVSETLLTAWAAEAQLQYSCPDLRLQQRRRASSVPAAA